MHQQALLRRQQSRRQRNRADGISHKAITTDGPFFEQSVALEIAIAPNFSSESGRNVRTALDLKGQRVVLYFYPKDDRVAPRRPAISETAGTASATLEYMCWALAIDSATSHTKFITNSTTPFTF